MKKKFLLLSLATLCATAVSATKYNIGVEAGYDFAHYRQANTISQETILGSEHTVISDVNYQHDQVIDHTHTEFVNGYYKKGSVITEQTGRLPQMHGFHIGPTFDARFSDKHGLGMRFALQYQFLTTNGGIYDKIVNGERVSANPLLLLPTAQHTYSHTLSVPVRLSYTWTVKNDWDIWLMTGPKFNFGVSFTSEGKYNIDGEEYSALYNYYSGQYYVNNKNVATSDYKYTYYPLSLSWGFGFGFSYKGLGFYACYELGLSDMQGYKACSAETIASATYYYSRNSYNNQLQLTLTYTFPVKQKASAAK